MKRSEGTVVIVLAIVFSLTFVLYIYFSSTRELSGLENVLLVLFSLLASMAASFFFGRYSAGEAAKEIIKPHARSAFRRLQSLYKSLSRVAKISGTALESTSPEDHKLALLRLESIATEQIAAANDALDDWRDIVPEDVEELEQRYSEQKNREEIND
jgi:hypothetical protein